MVRLEEQAAINKNDSRTPSSSSSSIKSTLAKEKLCDDDFDKLVIDTSHRVTNQEKCREPDEEEGEQEDNEKESITNVACCSLENRTLLNNLLDEDLNYKSSSTNYSSLISTPNTTTQDSSSNSNHFDCNNNNNIKLRTTSCELHKSALSQPKRPMNAFMVWGQAIRRNLHLRFSNVQNALLSKSLGRVWRSLDAAEKEPYIRKANVIKANHKRDYPNYRYQPRRIQERRNKSHTLIGIQLNHPVNEHPKRLTTFTSQPRESNNFNYISNYVDNSQQQHPRELEDKNNNNNFYFNDKRNNDSILAGNQTTNTTYGDTNISAPAATINTTITATATATTTTTNTTDNNNNNNNNNNNVTGQDCLVKEGKHLGGVQTFEYQPYPSSMQSNLESSLTFDNGETIYMNNNDNRDNNDNNNFGTVKNNYINGAGFVAYNNDNNIEQINVHNNQLQTGCLVRSKPASLISYNEQAAGNVYYPTTTNSQFSSYNVMQQQQQQQFDNNINYKPTSSSSSISFNSNHLNDNNDNRNTNVSCGNYLICGSKQSANYYEHTLDTNSSHQINNLNLDLNLNHNQHNHHQHQQQQQSAVDINKHLHGGNFFRSSEDNLHHHINNSFQL